MWKSKVHEGPRGDDAGRVDSATPAHTSTLEAAGRGQAKVDGRPANVRFGSLADMCNAQPHVRFTPNSGKSEVSLKCPLSAISGHRRQLTRNARLLRPAIWTWQHSMELAVATGTVKWFIQQKDTASFNRKAVARTCSCISLRLSAQA